jgi:hypothetical protein
MENATTGQRPVFLTVLCILSFIGGSWGVLEGVRNAFTNAPEEEVEEARTAIEEAMTQVEGAGADFALKMMEEGLVMAEQAAANAVPLGYIGLITSLLGLAGVWFMWNLKKSGFYLYAAASLGGLLLPFAFIGFGMMGLLGLGLGGFISVLFIVLYAIHLKYMN